jgi:hypothetical protein
MTLDLSVSRPKPPSATSSAWLEHYPEDQDDIVRVLRDVRYSNGLISDVLRGQRAQPEQVSGGQPSTRKVPVLHPEGAPVWT